MQEKTLGDLIEAARHVRSEKSLSYAELAKACGGKPTAARLQQYVTGTLKNFPDPESILGLAKGTGSSSKEIILASARSLGLNIESDPEDLIFINGISTLPPSAAESFMSIGRELVNLSRKVDHEPQDQPETNPPINRTLRAVGPSGEVVQGQKIRRIADQDDEPTERIKVSDILRSMRERRNEGRGIEAIMLKFIQDNESYIEENFAFVDARSILEHAEPELVSLTVAAFTDEGMDGRKAVIATVDEFLAKLRDVRAVVPPLEKLAAHPYFKTKHEEFEEQLGERGEENQDPDLGHL